MFHETSTASMTPSHLMISELLPIPRWFAEGGLHPTPMRKLPAFMRGLHDVSCLIPRLLPHS